jgi:hypothetical protein
LRHHVGIAVLVMMPLLIRLVYGTVAFNYNLRLATIEIRYIFTKLMLSSELKTQELPISKKLP